MRYAPISSIPIDAMAAAPIMTSNGEILINRNTKITPFMMNALKDRGYTGVYIYDDLSRDVAVRQDIPLDLKVRAAQAAAKKDPDACIYLASDIANELLSGDRIIKTNLENLGDYDSRTFMHSVNVATYSGILGIVLGFTEGQIKNLIAAGMMHDIGKVNIPKEILLKDGPLTEEEQKLVHQHPKLGYEMIKDYYSVQATTKVAVFEHHENEDGSGYPRHLESDAIHIYAKILHVCDVYDAMISKRSYKEAINPCDTLEFIMSQVGKMFDENIVNTFIRVIEPFPVGMQVELSDGTQAIVIQSNRGFIQRPKIRLIKTGEDIDLMETLNLTIVKVANYE